MTQITRMKSGDEWDVRKHVLAFQPGATVLAGGASHRTFTTDINAAPAGAGQESQVYSVAPPGAILLSHLNRWLAPPANFHQPFGLE